MIGKVTIKDIYLNVNEVERLQEIIERELKICPDSQIYIEKTLYYEISWNGSQHHIFSHNYLEGEDDEEKFGFHETHAFSDTISRVFLIGNCHGYMQLTRFRNKDIDYTNYSAGMKQIIIVYAE